MLNFNSARKYLPILFLIYFTSTYSQQLGNYINGIPTELDKCGHIENDSLEVSYISPDYMGYSYDSLLADLELWKLNQYIKVDSIGLSVQGRPLWQLTISSDPNNIEDKRVVHIHARTHPQETEGFYVTDEMIKILTSETPFAQTVRSNCVFYVIPMYNPDGVVLGRPRNNANNIDLESNWNTTPHQPEVAALKARFIELMAKPHPIEVMLNMHSSSRCLRYFVYHHENGTSNSYALLEQDFINGVRSYFPGGIEPYTSYISWTTGTGIQYPEGWFWINHNASVMALTYEDMYQCPSTGKFDSTAFAILNGAMDYLGIATGVEDNPEYAVNDFILSQNFPNPFNPITKINFNLSSNSIVSLKIRDILGNEVASLVKEEKSAGSYTVEFNANNLNLSSGIYFYSLQAGEFIQTKKMTLLK